MRAGVKQYGAGVKQCPSQAGSEAPTIEQVSNNAICQKACVADEASSRAGVKQWEQMSNNGSRCQTFLVHPEPFCGSP